MGKKEKDGKKFEVPVEAKEKVEHIMATLMFTHLSEREIYQALEESQMDCTVAMLGLHYQEMKRKGQEEEEEQREGGGTGAKGESRAFPDCPKQENKEALKEREMGSHNAIQRRLAQEKGKTRAGVPAEWKEQIQRIKETLKEMGRKFTEEQISEMLKRCKMDPNLAAERLLANSLEVIEEVKSKRTKKKARIDAQESKSQQEVSSSGSSSSIIKQGGRDDNVERKDTPHDNTVQGIQVSLSRSPCCLDRSKFGTDGEVDSNARSQLDNVSSPPAAARSSVASQSRHLNIGKGKGKKGVRSTDNTAVVSRSHVPPLRASGLLGTHASRAGSDFRPSRNNVANSSRNDSGKFPSALGRLSTTRNRNGSELNEERSIRGRRTCATLPMPSKPEEQEIPHYHACQAPANTYNPNSVGSGTFENELFLTSNEPRALSEAGLANWRRHFIQSILNDPPDLPSSAFNQMTYSSMEHPAMTSMNAPPFTPSASIHQSSQTLLQGNSLSTGRGFTHPHGEPSYYQPQLPLQHGYMNRDGDMHQSFAYDMTSPQQEVYQGGSLSWANADPSSWGSFLGRGNTPNQFLPDLPAPSDSSGNQLNSALHLQAQHQHRNYYFPIGTSNNFAAWNNQLDPGAMSALPEQQQGGFPGWVPLPSDGNNQHLDMPSAQQEVYQGGGSSWANANASGWGSIQGTGSISYQSSPNPPHSPAPFNISWSSHESTLQAEDQSRNDHHLLIYPRLALTPRGSFPGRVPLPANARNQHTGEGSFPQYVHQGSTSLDHPGTRVRPNHQQQNPHNMSTGNLQDSSTMQPP